MALWELEQFQNPQFLGFIRSIPVPAEFQSGQASGGILPAVTVPTLEYEYVLGANGSPAGAVPMAHVMGWDSEAPMAGRKGYNQPFPPEATVRGELPPIKRKAKLSEKEIIKFKQPRPGTSDEEDVVNYVYDLTADLVTSIQSRIEWLGMQAISEDVITINSEGVDVQVDFGIPTTQQFNVATDANFSGVWTDTTNSNAVTDLDYIANGFEVVHGFRPAKMLCDQTTNLLLLTNLKLLELIRGPGAPTIRLTQDELDALFGIYELPTLQPYNVVLYEENHDGSTVAVRPFNRNKAVLLPPDGIEVGNVLYGPTAEARSIPGVAYTQYAPGIVGSVYGKDEPPAEFVKVAAVAFPTLPGAQNIVQMRVRSDL